MIGNCNGRYKLIEINKSSSFFDIASQITRTWCDLQFENISCSFTVGEVINCYLGSDDDLRNMFLLCQIKSHKIVVVVVIKSSYDCTDSGKGVESTFAFKS